MIHKVESQPIKHSCGTSDWESGWEKALNYHKKPHLRVKRSETKRRFMEVLVVADKKFLDHHKNDDPERYILTVMNMVSDYYHDASTGQQIDLVVVRIIQLEEDQPKGLEITANGTKSLTSFCKWQHEQNPKDDKHPQHHDTAILLTRQDICADGSCDLLGLAYIASVCIPDDSCSINEDNGLMLGVTITHEVGHLMGCDHDNDQECSAQDDRKFNHVMAPSVSLATSQWSKCSQRYMQELFDNKLGECLNDEPETSTYKLDESLPGTLYDGDFQCRMLFGEKTKVCQWDVEKICERLMCQVDDKCRSNGTPAADGTPCGHDKWCMKKECVRIGKRNDDAVAGGWSDWGEWSVCSETCGGGIQFSGRDCTSPIPKNGGRYCLGERKRYQVCNTKPCPPKTPSHRQLQCAEFDDKNHHWAAYFKPSESCVLYCKNEKHEVHRKAVRAKDGIFCRPGANDMCIAGECKVGKMEI